jgi:hypothetical protein
MERDLIHPTPSEPDYSAARAFARVGWPKVWARLLRYATGTLGLAAIGARRAGVVDAADFASTLVVWALGGTLAWSLPEDATDERILRYACTKLYGMRSTLRRQAARTSPDDAIDERPDPGPDVLARLMKERRLGDLERFLEGDAEASAYLDGMLANETRAEIARRLGWPVRRAQVVRVRLLRRLAAHAQRTNDDGEDRPPRRSRSRKATMTTTKSCR